MKGKLMAAFVFQDASHAAVHVSVWRNNGYHVRTFRRVVRADGEAVEVTAVIVRERAAARAP